MEEGTKAAVNERRASELSRASFRRCPRPQPPPPPPRVLVVRSPPLFSRRSLCTSLSTSLFFMSDMASSSVDVLPLHPREVDSASVAAPMRESMESGSQPGHLVSSGLNPVPLRNDVGACELICPSKLSCCLFSLFFPSILGCCHQVDVRNESVLLNYGRYIGTLREPGCYCVNPCGTEKRTVNTAVNSMDLPQLKVLDKRGNPLRVSGVVNWVVVDSRKAILDVQQYQQFLKSQAEVVMKQICSAHPYEAKPGSNEDSLKTESAKISADVIQLLQKKVSQAGLRVIEYQVSTAAARVTCSGATHSPCSALFVSDSISVCLVFVHVFCSVVSSLFSSTRSLMLLRSPLRCWCASRRRRCWTRARSWWRVRWPSRTTPSCA